MDYIDLFSLIIVNIHRDIKITPEEVVEESSKNSTKRYSYNIILYNKLTLFLCS